MMKGIFPIFSTPCLLSSPTRDPAKYDGVHNPADNVNTMRNDRDKGTEKTSPSEDKPK